MAHRDVIVVLRHNGEEVARMVSRVEVWRRGDLNRTLEENFGPLVQEIIRTAEEAGEEVGELAVRLSLQDDGTDPFPVYFHFDPPEAVEETEYRGTYEMDDGETIEIWTWDGRLVSRERARVVPAQPDTIQVVANPHRYWLTHIDEEGRGHYLDIETGQRFTTPDIDNEYVWTHADLDSAILAPAHVYEPIESDDRFYYFGLDPAQAPHGSDGGTPMTLAELLSADEKMDRIDGVLDRGLDEGA